MLRLCRVSRLKVRISEMHCLVHTVGKSDAWRGAGPASRTPKHHKNNLTQVLKTVQVGLSSCSSSLRKSFSRHLRQIALNLFPSRRWKRAQGPRILDANDLWLALLAPSHNNPEKLGLGLPLPTRGQEKKKRSHLAAYLGTFPRPTTPLDLLSPRQQFGGPPAIAPCSRWPRPHPMPSASRRYERRSNSSSHLLRRSTRVSLTFRASLMS